MPFHLLAQNLTVPGKEDWWLERGVLGALVLFGLACVLGMGVHYFRIRTPYWKRKQELELEKDEKLNKYLESQTATERERLDISHRTVEILEKMDARQESHNDVCHVTHKLASETKADVAEIKRRLEQIHLNVAPNHS